MLFLVLAHVEANEGTWLVFVDISRYLFRQLGFSDAR